MESGTEFLGARADAGDAGRSRQATRLRCSRFGRDPNVDHSGHRDREVAALVRARADHDAGTEPACPADHAQHAPRIR